MMSASGKVRRIETAHRREDLHELLGLNRFPDLLVVLDDLEELLLRRLGFDAERTIGLFLLFLLRLFILIFRLVLVLILVHLLVFILILAPVLPAFLLLLGRRRRGRGRRRMHRIPPHDRVFHNVHLRIELLVERVDEVPEELERVRALVPEHFEVARVVPERGIHVFPLRARLDDVAVDEALKDVLHNITKHKRMRLRRVGGIPEDGEERTLKPSRALRSLRVFSTCVRRICSSNSRSRTRL